MAKRDPQGIVLRTPENLSRGVLPDAHHSRWEDIIDLRRILQRLYKRKHYVALAVVLVVVPAAIGTFLMTPLYLSNALVQVNPDPVQVVPYRDVADNTGGAANIENYMGTQEQILRGPGLRERVSKRLAAEYKNSPAAKEAAFLADRFDLKKIEKSELFQLSYTAETPEAAAVVVNLFAEEYAKQNFELRQETRIKAEQDLAKELDGLERRMQASEKELTTYAKANDIVSLEQGQVDPLQDRLSSVGQQLVDSEAQLVTARASLESLQTASVDQFPQRLVTQEVGQLQATLNQLEQQLTTLRSTFGENWPAVVEKRNEVNLVREQLKSEKAAVLARSLEQARIDVQAAEAKRNETAKSLGEQKVLVNRFHDASIRYNILKREVDTNRNLYEGLLQRLKQTGVMAGFQFGNIHVVEPGRPNRIADSPKVLWNLGLAALLGLGLGIASVVLLDTWDTSITSIEEAEQLVALPTLGSVPLMKAAKPQLALPGATSTVPRLPLPRTEQAAPAQPAASQEATWTFDESIRAVCASILLSRSDERPRVVAITSAMHEEGKTTVTTHLGKAFADAGVRTLLVEADLRKPDLSRSFAIGREDGLSLYLAGHVSQGPKIHATGIPNLFVTAGGPHPPNPAALLHSDRLDQFLARAMKEYDLVLLDTPPLLSMADARIVGTRADGVVLVIRAGKTGRNLVRRARVQLESSGANVLGLVLNGWEPDRAELSHYRYYQQQSA